MALFDGLLACGTLVPEQGHYALTDAGRDEMSALGVALPAEASGTAASRRFAHACFDWSERRDHLAGSFAVALLDHGLAQGWLRRVQDTRALQLTPPGARALARWIQSPPSSSPSAVPRHAR